MTIMSNNTIIMLIWSSLIILLIPVSVFHANGVQRDIISKHTKGLKPFKHNKSLNNYNIGSNDIALNDTIAEWLTQSILPVRQKRSVRPTKSYEYKESVGAVRGILAKNNPQKEHKMETPNRLVTVDTTGAIKVKEPWDYEALANEKTLENTTPQFTDIMRQRIFIHPKNVNYELPIFINSPLPMQAVVELDAKPGTIVYKLEVRVDTNTDIYYEPDIYSNCGRFEVDERSGEVRTRGAQPFILDKEYVIDFYAMNFIGAIYKWEQLSIIGGKRAPQFYTQRYEVTIPENHSKYSYIIEVKAKSFAAQYIRYTLRSESDHNKGMFTIGPNSGVVSLAKELENKHLPQPKIYTLVVIATAFYDYASYGRYSSSVELSIKVTDFNRYAPFFPDSLYFGSVTENSTKGLTVMTMTATDYDDPNEGSNAKLKYSIEQNQVNENGESIFAIDEQTGVITTAVCCLDRETTPEYTIKVVAMDGGKLTATTTGSIKLNDINDMPPKFSNKDWFVELNDNCVLPFVPILLLTVNDEDLHETNRFCYKVNENSVGSDMFTIVTNSDGTGSLMFVRPLVYKDTHQKYGFNMTISVHDNECESSDAYHIDYANVFVRLRYINANKLNAEKPNTEVTVLEDTREGTSLATFTATDADWGGKSIVSYKIDRTSDKRHQFSVDQNGCVAIHQKLDREETPRYELKILAIDDGVPPRTATATLTVDIEDINDNAPRFLKDYRPVIFSNQSSPQLVEQIFATDYDYRFKKSRGNGPPFTFRMDPNASETVRKLFVVQDHTYSDEMASVYTKKKFDHKFQTEYLVPIIIEDSGYQPMTGTSTLTVTVRDSEESSEYHSLPEY